MLDTATQARIWAQQAKGVSTSAKWVLMMLAFRVNGQSGNFDVWPSHKCIAEDAEMSVSSVKNHLNELLTAGFLKIIPQVKADGRSKTSNIYRLQVRMSVQTPAGNIKIDCDTAGQDHSQTLAMGSADPQPNFDCTPASTLPIPIANCLPMELLNKNYGSELGHTASDEAPAENQTLDLLGMPDVKTKEEIQQEDEAQLLARIESSWGYLAGKYPGIAAIRGIDDRRARLLMLRTRQAFRADKDISHDEMWGKFFENIEKSSFLKGMAPPGRDRSEPFRLTFDFILVPKNFSKILEGGFNDRFTSTAQGFDPDSGRRYSPVEEAVRNVDAQLRAGAERRGPGEHHGGTEGRRPGNYLD